MSSQRKTVVSSLSEAIENIENYGRELAKTKALQKRIGMHPAWYAIKNDAGEWVFGPSKFIGYAANSAEHYLKTYDRTDGKETEPVLQAWFEPVAEGSAEAEELKSAFRKFAARFGKFPNKRWRVSVAKGVLDSGVPARRAKRGGPLPAPFERIAADPAICGGKPTIRGTRMRVSDIVDMIAEGASPEEILEDFPYLARDDIQAALKYAARALDHALIRAA